MLLLHFPNFSKTTEPYLIHKFKIGSIDCDGLLVSLGLIVLGRVSATDEIRLHIIIIFMTLPKMLKLFLFFL